MYMIRMLVDIVVDRLIVVLDNSFCSLMLILNSCRISIWNLVLWNYIGFHFNGNSIDFLLKKKNWIIKSSNIIEMKSCIAFILGFVFSYCAEMVNFKSFLFVFNI